MKALWQIVSRKNALWIDIVTAKYLSRCNIWRSTRTATCTAMWRAIMELRAVLKPKVKWQMGTGTACNVFDEPWHDLWETLPPNGRADRRLKVADLLLTDGNWDNSKLIQTLGFYGALYIALSFPRGLPYTAREDRLILTCAKNGELNLKAAYNLIYKATYVQHPISHQMKALLSCIWQTEGLLPRTRIFMWKALKHALPTDQLISTRIGRPSQECQLCGENVEDTCHVMFKCQKARQSWLSSSLGLRSDSLPDNIPALLADTVLKLNGED